MPFVNRGHKLAPTCLWLFNEGSGNKVFDLSGNGRYGTFGGNAPDWVAGDEGNALYFNAEQADTIGVNAFPFVPAPFTIVAHVRKSSDYTGGYRSIINRGRAYDSGNTNFDFGTVGLCAYIGWYNSDSWYEHQASLGTYLDLWIDIAVVVYSNYDNELFKNGISIGTDASNAAPADGSQNTIIGEGHSDWHGDISRIYFYNRALSASEIDLLYREPFCMFERGPIAMMAIEAPPPSGGQVITIIQAGMAPVIFIFIFFTLFCFIKGRKCRPR